MLLPRLPGRVLARAEGAFARSRLAAALAAACLFACVPASRAGDGNPCLSYASVHDAAEEAHHELKGSRLMEYDADNGADRLAEILGLEFDSDRILALQYSDGTVQFGFAAGGCLIASKKMSARNWERVVEVFGRDS